MVFKPIISVGFNKAGEADFMVDSSVYDLAPKQLNDLAATCFAAFHAAYSMRNAREGNLGKLRDDNEED